jgi:hypothetical protein
VDAYGNEWTDNVKLVPSSSCDADEGEPNS